MIVLRNAKGVFMTSDLAKLFQTLNDLEIALYKQGKMLKLQSHSGTVHSQADFREYMGYMYDDNENHRRRVSQCFELIENIKKGL